MSSASAPGKVILFGEHAVVYGRPAIAAPISQIRATATVSPAAHDGVRLEAPDLGRSLWLHEAAADHPLAAAVRLVEAWGERPLNGLTLTAASQIPIASGLGSGAAISAAIIRALADHLDLPLSLSRLSALTYEVEKIHHGAPSGIDNTVVAYEQPVYFVRRRPENLIEPFRVAAPLRLLVADTGLASSTKVVVGDVRRQWQEEPERFERIFAGCGRIAMAARRAIERGDVKRLGRLMNQNQALLVEMTVSAPALDRLAAAATAAGALGAKLSGAGRGGNMIALVTPETETAVGRALRAAGAQKLLTTIIGNDGVR
jgi:mevalonate kinase